MSRPTLDKKTRKALAITLTIVLLLILAGVIYYVSSIAKNAEIYDTLQETAVSTPQPTEDAIVEPPEEENENEDAFVVDFTVLHAINPDIYAWICIDGLDVSYPVVQHATDHTYYLNHTVEGVSGYPGSIYTENIDATDFSDFNTVIYGHNMANNTIFGSLSSYRSLSLFDAYSEIFIYTETETRIYQVFAAVVYDDRYLPSVYDDSSVEDRQAYLDSIYNNSNSADIVDTSILVTTDSQLITLSTCIGDLPDNRYLVVAVYVGNAD